ncbi:hypothetical protein [Klebsiella pneumoniae]|uniref:hypothetical protein n=1 Tax=Klebsiella pneumoniae TaxID=573 RepID=UPI00296F8FFB|nr:hypothetical protein [Klebsiella pneumoniae]
MKKSPLAVAMKKRIGGNDEIQKVEQWLDTGFPPLNEAVSGDLEGGLPCGRIVEIFGPPSAGKTFLATRAMIAAQKVGGIAVFLDHENSFDVGLAEVMGLQSDEDEGNWVYKQPDTFEDAIDLTGQILSLVRKENLIPAEAPIVIVYDSLASMVPRQKFEKFEKMADGTAKEKDELNMNDNTALARATSANLPTLAKWAQKYNACLIFLNQVRTKWASCSETLPLPVRRLPKFYASVRIKLGGGQLKEGGDRVGQLVKAECVKTRWRHRSRNASGTSTSTLRVVWTS